MEYTFKRRVAQAFCEKKLNNMHRICFCLDCISVCALGCVYARWTKYDLGFFFLKGGVRTFFFFFLPLLVGLKTGRCGWVGNCAEMRVRRPGHSISLLLPIGYFCFLAVPNKREVFEHNLDVSFFSAAT